MFRPAYRGARLQHSDGDQPGLNGKVAIPVMHDGPVVVGHAQAVDVSMAILVKVLFCVCNTVNHIMQRSVACLPIVWG